MLKQLFNDLLLEVKHNAEPSAFEDGIALFHTQEDTPTLSNLLKKYLHTIRN